MALINKRLAIFLVQCGFAIFLGLDQMIVDGSKAPLKMFTTRPKNKEIFVGDSVVFDWDYKQEDELDKISFGIVSNGSEGKNIALFIKRADGIIYMNSKYPRFKEILPRIKVVEGKRASFRIDNVRMNDTGKFFCKISKKGDIRTDRDYVDLKVVDLQIDKNASSSVEESWKNKTIFLMCVVRVVKNTPVTFTWLRQPNNETLSRGKHIDTRTESMLKITTSSEQHFTTYTCVAKTKRTTKLHNVLVRQLYRPVINRTISSQKVATWVGYTAKLICYADSNPEPKYTWTNASGVVSVSEVSGILEITPTDDSAFGDYTCEAMNSRGRDSHTVTLIKVGKPGPVSLKITESRIKSLRFQWKVIESGHSDITHFIVQSRKVGEQAWKITYLQAYETEYELQGLEPFTDYEIRVLASNKYFTSAPSEIIGRTLEAGSPSFIYPPKNKTVAKGEQIRLICNATGHPTPNISWSKAGGTIKTGYVFGKILVIPYANQSDAGRYICTAKNAYGGQVYRTSVEVFVTVKLRPHSPVPSSTQITDLSIKVHWKKPESHGYPVLMYSVHRVDLDEAGQEVTSRAYHVNEDVHQYEVGDIVRGKSYKFYVTAWNTHGESVKDHSKSITVNVQQP